MDVYLKNGKEKDTFHFPVNPIGNIMVNRNKKFNTVDIIDLGEFDILDKGKKIKELSFNTLLPSKYDTYCRYIDIPKPTEAIAKLEKWMEQQDPLRLIITDFNFNDLVVISQISEEERSGENGDKYISINFRAYRELKIQRVSTAKASTLKNNRPNTKTSKRHVVGEWIVITADVLNVRSGPGTNYPIIGSVKNGQSYKIGRIQGNWADIYWGDSGGWISLDYVK
ncbi:putative peptidoglycan-binding LysM protein [uncultured Caudovirales phage]|uniref:Putative peptidoglycan-binding LysM protein n=1 Tax=uncultured Caudovirales phage TaxID=2100421 RepID=A0A2H4J045_9CAUD|nr:putative peptidoglycan-binding LysM protein [uncultured Caudovirales phage]